MTFDWLIYWFRDGNFYIQVAFLFNQIKNNRIKIRLFLCDGMQFFDSQTHKNSQPKFGNNSLSSKLYTTWFLITAHHSLRRHRRKILKFLSFPQENLLLFSPVWGGTCMSLRLKLLPVIRSANLWKIIKSTVGFGQSIDRYTPTGLSAYKSATPKILKCVFTRQHEKSREPRLRCGQNAHWIFVWITIGGLVDRIFSL